MRGLWEDEGSLRARMESNLFSAHANFARAESAQKAKHIFAAFKIPKPACSPCEELMR